jgi:hypothetical protein
VATAVKIIAAAVACFGVFVVVANYAAVFTNSRNAKRGIDRHVSLVPLIGPGLVTISWLPFAASIRWSGWLIAAVWLLDLGTWVMVHALVYWGALALRSGRRPKD